VSADIKIALPSSLVNPGSPEGKQAREPIKKCARIVGSAKMCPQGIVFGIDGAFNALASKKANALALRALLDCLIDLDLIWLQANPMTPALYESGVFYHLMPANDPWDTIPTLYQRGFGDCKSLAAARIAELRRFGKIAIPVFRHVKDGWGTMFHILILHGDGTWECPSRILGMRTAQESPGYSTE
jgi:hypothetical protein